MSERFSIRRLRLRHYRSIAACDVTLGPLTLLVGPNGAGKSNFVDSLRFVSQALNENLDNALRERGGAAETRRRSTGHPTHFGVRLNFDTDSLGGEYAFQIAAVAGGDFRVSHEALKIESTEFGLPAAHFDVRDGNVINSSEQVLPRVSEDRLFLTAMSGLERFRPVFDGLASMNVHSLNPDSMRLPQKPDPGELLARDGSNVASVLENVRRTRPEVLARIEAYLRSIVPGVESVSRKGLGAWETLEFKQRVAGSSSPWTFQASSMSDGTLRALGVLVALFAVDEPFSSPVGIEEPETALHPAASGLLLEALVDASRSRQVLATSHSPDLLDSPTITPDMVLAVRADSGNSIIGRLDRASSDALRESLFTAGELLRVDQLAPHPEGQPTLELFS